MKLSLPEMRVLKLALFDEVEAGNITQAFMDKVLAALAQQAQMLTDEMIEQLAEKHFTDPTTAVLAMRLARDRMAQQAQPDLRDAMIEVLESTPYSSIEFAPGLRYLKETIIAGLTQVTRKP